MMKKNSIDARHPHPVIVLVGQPNCGKSTIFNYAAGYRSITTNFPGVTVEYLRSHVAIGGRQCNLVDLPGIYSLTAVDEASQETKRYLLENKVDVLINVIDASVLSRSLELTLQLTELGLPMVLCLNMMDEAQRKGIVIHTEKLASLLGIPVLSTVASQGKGLQELFAAAFSLVQNPVAAPRQKLSRHVESKVTRLLEQAGNQLASAGNPRLAVLKLLEKDSYFQAKYSLDRNGQIALSVAQQELEAEHDDTAESVIAAERHHLAMKLFEQAAEVKPRRQTWVDRLDELTTHPIIGYGLMTLLLLAFFVAVFRVGNWVESPLMAFWESVTANLVSIFGEKSIQAKLLQSSMQGLSGGMAIVLPYLLPFLLAMAFIEDTGYLSRIAFLMDGLMHRVGLHGAAIVPVILGYGCSVPAVMATRVLATQRDRFIAAVIAVLVPCSARMVVIMALVGFYLGGTAAFSVYLINALTVLLTGAALSHMLPADSPGLILEMPPFRWPKLRVVLAKTWLRLKEFVFIAWPLLIVGSVILAVIDWLHWTPVFNMITRPITLLLGLPESVGMTLFFGILRKELTLLMLLQALGTQNVAAAMTSTQIWTFTLFVVFYLPCAATLGIMAAEMGWKKTAAAAGVSFALALGIAFSARLVGGLIG